jgi:peptidoglycan/xylan/chitin deacetylase (PgdA/CDA1 family)
MRCRRSTHRGNVKYTARQYATRSITLLKRAGARIDRRARWTLVPLLLVVVIFASPIWSAAVRFTSHAAASADSLRVPILVYHSIAPMHVGQSAEQRLLDVDTATFRRQMSYLAANRYTVISLETLIDALDGRGSLSPRSVVITFDDGWLSQYEHALPVLEQLHFTATFFVISLQVGKGSMYMGLDELKTLQHAGMTIASHSRTHPNLTKLSDAQVREEVLGSRQDLQKMLGINVDLFAYPYGSWNKRTAAAVQGAGYRAARAFPGGSWNDVAERYELHSVLVMDDMETFVRELSPPIVAMGPSAWRIGQARLALAQPLDRATSHRATRRWYFTASHTGQRIEAGRHSRAARARRRAGVTA